jgi:hypothetical protein
MFRNGCAICSLIIQIFRHVRCRPTQAALAVGTHRDYAKCETSPRSNADSADTFGPGRFFSAASAARSTRRLTIFRLYGNLSCSSKNRSITIWTRGEKSKGTALRRCFRDASRCIQIRIHGNWQLLRFLHLHYRQRWGWDDYGSPHQTSDCEFSYTGTSTSVSSNHRPLR